MSRAAPSRFSNGRLLGVGELLAEPASPTASPPLQRAGGVPKPHHYKKAKPAKPAKPARPARPAVPARVSWAPMPPPPRIRTGTGATGLPRFLRCKPLRDDEALGERHLAPKRPRPASPEGAGPGTLAPLKKGDAVLVVEGAFARARATVAAVDKHDDEVIVRLEDGELVVVARTALEQA